MLLLLFNTKEKKYPVQTGYGAMMFNTFVLLETFLKDFISVSGNYQLLVGSYHKGGNP